MASEGPVPQTVACAGAVVVNKFCRMLKSMGPSGVVQNSMDHTHHHTQRAKPSKQSERAARMEKKWRVGDLQTIQGAHPSAITMTEFVLHDEEGSLVSRLGMGATKLPKSRGPRRRRGASQIFREVDGYVSINVAIEHSQWRDRCSR